MALIATTVLTACKAMTCARTVWITGEPKLIQKNKVHSIHSQLRPNPRSPSLAWFTKAAPWSSLCLTCSSESILKCVCVCVCVHVCHLTVTYHQTTCRYYHSRPAIGQYDKCRDNFVFITFGDVFEMVRQFANGLVAASYL